MGCCLKCGKRDLRKQKSTGLRYCPTCGCASMGGRFNTAGFPVSDEERRAIAARQIAVAAYIAAARAFDLPEPIRPRLSLRARLRGWLTARGRQISRCPEDRRDPACGWCARLLAAVRGILWPVSVRRPVLVRVRPPALQRL